MLFHFLALLTVVVPAARSSQPRPAQDYAVPLFPVGDRAEKIARLRPEIDKLYSDFAAERHVPGIVYGVMLDGRLVHRGAIGMANVDKHIPAALDTRFRIASMTKSFIALAIFRLRDAGRIGLYDAVEKYIPEFRGAGRVTVDAATITVRHLLTMTAGFPEDNPWGDRQLAVSVGDLLAFVRGGISMSTAPGMGFEYSNFGYALLGQIISAVTQEPYQRYVTREILAPLGMKDTCWEFAEVPPMKLAQGYRWEDNRWQAEPMLHDGTYGAMGGLLTTLEDFARYVGLHLAAWPPRNDPDDGIVRRATLREMHKPVEVTSLVAAATNPAGGLGPSVVGYGYGLRWSMDHRNVVNLGHSGGLPGFGSNYRFYPDHGFAVISFANLTYAGMSAINAKVGALLLEQGALPARTLPPSSVLESRRDRIVELIKSWDEPLAGSLVAENFFLDRSRDAWQRRSREVFSLAGAIRSVGPVMPENQLRGTFPIATENGRVDVFFTLTPESEPRLQDLRLTFVKKP